MKSERADSPLDPERPGGQRRHSDESERSRDVLEALRCALTFLPLFAVILLGLVVSKVCILSVTSHLRSDAHQNDENKSGWTYLVLLSVCVPYAVTFLHTGVTLTMGIYSWPSLRIIVTALATEGVHCFGLTLLLFRVLPELDVVRGLLAMSAFGIVPAVANMIPGLKGRQSARRRRALLTLDSVALLGQLSSVATFISCPQRELIIWELPAAIICVSLSYGWNFCNDHVHAKKPSKLPTSEAACELNDWRTVLTFLAQPVKVVFMCYFTFAISGDELQPVVPALAAVMGLHSQKSAAVSVSTLAYAPDATGVAHFTDGTSIAWIIRWLPLATLIVAPFLVFYASAISTRMRSIAFSSAIALASPVSVLAATYLSFRNVRDSALERFGLLPTSVNDDAFALHLFLGTTWWLSQLWISRYAWMPQQFQKQNSVRCVSAPTYCAVLLEACLVYNSQRERRMRDITRTAGAEGAGENQGSASAEGTDMSSLDVVPMIYICATMWHENEKEMMQMLTSIVRLDEDQATRKNAHMLLQLSQPDVILVDRNYYTFEAHVFFDDAMELNENDEWTINAFVRKFVTVVDQAVHLAFNRRVALQPPTKCLTPYGGRLTWVLPGENRLIVHLKDKSRVRHRKRWSQVMYMYYLLGHQLLGATDVSSMDKQRQARTDHIDQLLKSSPLSQLPESIRVQADHTFCLAIDGDVDFQPQAVHLLVDRLKRSRKAGVVCGRIHPIGSGPIVWYQKFEYAISHWLQKAAEDVLGCVLCAPGAFSLFRASALMDDRVMGTYVRLATEARHYVQYEQGEDRWLTTLLLQRGYRVEYVAGADALTYAPESFGEFFNQRRRWTPSTMAHTLDLLVSWRHTMHVNMDISIPFVVYQAVIFLSWLLAPATVILMVAGALNNMFEMPVERALIVAAAPPAFFIVVCFTTKPKTQVNVAAIMSVASVFLMIALLMATLNQFAQKSPISFWGIFVMLQWFVFVSSAVFHPKELMCLFHGLLYYLCVISGYVLLVIYSMVNLHVVTWGTRETVRRRKARGNTGDNTNGCSDDQNAHGGTGRIRRALAGVIERTITKRSLLGTIAALLRQSFVNNGLEELSRAKDICHGVNSGVLRIQDTQHIPIISLNDRANLTEVANEDILIISGTDGDITEKGLAVRRQFSGQDCEAGEGRSWILDADVDAAECLAQPAWLDDACLSHCQTGVLPDSETSFWNGLISSYLSPLDDDAAHQAKMTSELKTLRNYVCLIFLIVNAMWIVLVFFFQLKSDTTKAFVIQLQYSPGGRNVSAEPISLAFLTASAVIMLVQYVCMLRHRWVTFRHLLEKKQLEMPSVTAVSCCGHHVGGARSATPLRWDATDAEQVMRDAIEITRRMHRASYAEDSDDENNNSGSKLSFREGSSGLRSDWPDLVVSAADVGSRIVNSRVLLSQISPTWFSLRKQFSRGLQEILRGTNKWTVPVAGNLHSGAADPA